MVDNLSNSFGDFKSEIRKEFASLKATNEQLYNHLSSRLPPWATILGGLLVASLSGFIGLGVGAS